MTSEVDHNDWLIVDMDHRDYDSISSYMYGDMGCTILDSLSPRNIEMIYYIWSFPVF